VVLNEALAGPPTAEKFAAVASTGQGKRQPDDRTTLLAGNDNRFAIVDEDLPVVTRSGIAAAGRLLE
jgi:hypothetical protein